MSKELLFPCETGFVIGPMTVEDTNAVGHALIEGIPQPTALAGFLHNMGRQVPVLKAARGMAIAVRSFEIAAGPPRHVPDKHNEKAAPIVDDRKGRLECILVLTATIGDGQAEEAVAGIDSFLSRARLAGGIIVGKPRVFATTDIGEMISRINAVSRRSHFLRSRPDLLEPEGPDDRRDPLDRMLDRLAKTKGQSRRGGFIVPVSIGYRALEKPSMDRQHRMKADDVPAHQYAEDVLGLGEFVPARRAIAEALQGCFWNYDTGFEEAGYHLTTTGDL